MMTVCGTCGTPYEEDHGQGQCEQCRPKRDYRYDDVRTGKGTAKQRGYDQHWRKLSRRARRLQPFCSDCGRTDDLTADHSTTAWQRHEQGLPIRLEDIDVVCRGCNADRGAARGDGATDEHRHGDTIVLQDIRAELSRPEVETLGGVGTSTFRGTRRAE